MGIDPVIQETTDFDWFGVDAEGFIGHFTHAGFKRLPASVASSAEDLKFVSEYFQKHAAVRGAHLVDETSLSSALNRQWRGEREETRYLRDFVAMADRGLFSFDIDSYLTPGIAYFRVACPLSPITVEQLPEEIRQVLARTRLAGMQLRHHSRIPYDLTLKM